MTDVDRPDDTELAREVADRAIRRLNLLEHLFLMVAAGAALLAGLLVTWLISQSFDVPFRTTWAISALVLFLFPASISWVRVRRDEREWVRKRDEHRAADSDTTS